MILRIVNFFKSKHKPYIRQALPFLFLCAYGILMYGATLKGVTGEIVASKVKNVLDQPTKPLELSPERGRFAIVMALAEYGTFSLPKDLGEMVYPDVGYINGKFYSFFAPGVSILALPFYLAGKLIGIPQVTSYAVTTIFAISNLLFIYLIATRILRLSTRSGLIAALVFGFGSTSWSYAITMYQHHLTTFLILSAFYAAWKFKQKSRYSFILALYIWFSYAYAIFVDYPNAILEAPVIGYFLYSAFGCTKTRSGKIRSISIRLSAFVAMAMFVILTVLHGYYNKVNFGSYTKVSGSLVSYKDIVEDNLVGNPDAENIIKKSRGVKNVVKFFHEDRLVSGLYTLLMSPDRGIFIYSPIFIASVIGIFLIVQTLSVETVTLLALITANLFLYSSWGDPWGGWAYGPRYMIPSMAILSLILAVLVNQLNIAGKIVIFFMFTFSSATALLGAITTNAVPPKIEADYLHTYYNFMYNLQFFRGGKSGSFLFTDYMSKFMPLSVYAGILYIVLLITMAVLLFKPRIHEVKP